MTNNTNRLTASDIARIAAAIRTPNFDPATKSAARRTTRTRKNIR